MCGSVAVRAALLAAAAGTALSLGAPRASAAPRALAAERALSTPAQADDGGSSQDRAKKHFDRAREHYAKGRYREAIQELEGALRLDPEGAELAYNLGVIYEKLQDVDSAILHYRRYVDMTADPEEQARVTKIILRLEGARDELAAAKAREREREQRPATEDRESEPVKKGRLDSWVLGAAALAGVAAITGGYFGIRALSERNDDPPTTSSGTSFEELEDNVDRSRQHALFADLSFGVAVAAGATAAILYFARDAAPTERTAGKLAPAQAGVAVVPGGAAAVLRMGF